MIVASPGAETSGGRPPRIVFAVAGYPAIGLGHFYRALMFAREFPSARVSFFCMRPSAPFAVELASTAYPTAAQRGEAPAREILRLAPDMVVNDFLDTEAAYMEVLKKAGVALVNFEDQGPGADLADLVVNSVYESPEEQDGRRLYGHKFFCLRDEFLEATPRSFHPSPERLLLTFGGTDPSDYTRQCLKALYPVCRELGMTIRIVAGPGYAHVDALQSALDGGLWPGVFFTHVSNVMAREMQEADVAVCSAGRTVYELTHMRIPALVLPQHEREERHGFASEESGFLRLSVSEAGESGRIAGAFAALLAKRKALYDNMSRYDFSGNKAGLVRRMAALLEEKTSLE
ncbi:MAG: hypothetical protein LBH65_00310 [Desulfovibrio sp.]|jgi:spore coat polysaccharide biosynthesis predicted glycosyltransferase SpsG|nr:hypothetical protein [Desulfovibrio sp.]